MTTFDFFQKRLLEIRNHLGLTQEQTAHVLGMEYKSYQKLESSSQKKDVLVSTIDKVAMNYGVKTHEFLSPRFNFSKLKPKRKPPLAGVHYQKSKKKASKKKTPRTK